MPGSLCHGDDGIGLGLDWGLTLFNLTKGLDTRDSDGADREDRLLTKPKTGTIWQTN